MLDPCTGLWHTNIACPTCRRRHPATWTCQYAGDIAAAQRTEREEQNTMPYIPTYPTAYDTVACTECGEQTLSSRPVCNLCKADKGLCPTVPQCEIPDEDTRPRITAKDFDQDRPLDPADRAITERMSQMRAELLEQMKAGATLPDEDVSDSERRVRTQAACVRAGKWPPHPDLTTVPLSSPRRGMGRNVLLSDQPNFFGTLWPEVLIRPAHKLNNDRSVAVSTDVFWNEDMTTCPRSVKVQLLGAGGVALYGTYDGKDPFYVGWAPVPRRRPA